MSQDTEIKTPQDLGALIRKRRKSLGMSQELLASMTGIAQPNLSNIERGKGASTLDTYFRLLRSLGVDLFGRERK